MRGIGQELALLRERAIEPVEQRVEAEPESPEFVGGILDRQPRATGRGYA